MKKILTFAWLLIRAAVGIVVWCAIVIPKAPRWIGALWRARRAILVRIAARRRWLEGRAKWN